MRPSLTLSLRRQTDTYILRGIRNLIVKDRRLKSDFLVYLGESDRRKLYAKEGYSSLFRWLTEHHGLSESSALKRIQVARLAVKYPFLYRDIAAGTYSLTALGRLAPFITAHNSHRLFSAAQKRSVREVEAFLAASFPKALVEDRLRKSVSPLDADHSHIQFTADSAFVSQLEEARALLSHKLPQGRLADVFRMALNVLIRDLKKDAGRSALDQAPQTPAALVAPSATTVSPPPPRRISPLTGKASSPSRYIPRGIRRDVASRDDRRCQFKKPDGSLCGETHFLEFDHVHPFALGGGHSRENLRLLCWTHNALRAEARFGKWPKNRVQIE